MLLENLVSRSNKNGNSWSLEKGLPGPRLTTEAFQTGSVSVWATELYPDVACFVFLTKFSVSGSKGKDGSLGSENDHSSSFFAGAIMDVKPRQPTCILEQFCNTEIFTHYA